MKINMSQEKSIEEKAKAYDELLVNLQNAKDNNNLCNERYCCVIDNIVPELKKSNDERIREAIYNCVEWFGCDSRFFKHTSQKDCLTWIEKQGEDIDKIVEKARTEKQRVLVTESDGVANIDWNTRNLEDARNLLECGLQYINTELGKKGEQDNNEDSNILQRFSFYSYKDESNILYLSSVYVNEDYRNKGIGTKILEVADEVAKSLNYHVIRLKTKKNSNAERLYRTHGYNSLATEEGDEIWLEKQIEIDKVSYEIVEKEKREFVGDGFIKCYADFQDFKEGETYWLEYIGNDKYNVRSDNLLGKTYHITPCQLYTIFKKQTWLEKQGDNHIQIDDKVTCNKNDSKPIDFYKAVRNLMNGIARGETYSPESIADKLLYIAKKSIKQDEQKPIDKVNPKFKIGDWVVSPNGVYWHIDDIGNGRYQVSSNSGECADWPLDTNIYHKFTIKDAKDGDILVSFTDNPFIYNGNFDEIFVDAYCGITVNNDFNECINECRWTYNQNIRPATKEQCNLLFQKMHEDRYDWYADKKELKKIKK